MTESNKNHIYPEYGDIWYIRYHVPPNKPGSNKQTPPAYKIRVIGVDNNSVTGKKIGTTNIYHYTMEEFLERGTFGREAGFWWRLWN